MPEKNAWILTNIHIYEHSFQIFRELKLSHVLSFDFFFFVVAFFLYFIRFVHKIVVLFSLNSIYDAIEVFTIYFRFHFFVSIRFNVYFVNFCLVIYPKRCDHRLPKQHSFTLNDSIISLFQFITKCTENVFDVLEFFTV